MAYTYGAVAPSSVDARGGSMRSSLRGIAAATAACCLVLVGLCGYSMMREDGATDSLLGVYSPGSILAFVDEGSNAIAFSPWAANGEMRKQRRTDVGEPGWEPGPDYYSTVKWDNAPIYPDTSHRLFDPYTGHEGCTHCDRSKEGAVVLSVSASCDSSGTTTNVKRILSPVLSDPFKSEVWANSRYEEWMWADHQLGYLLNFYEHLTLIVPPCFVPRYSFSWRSLGIMNEAIYQRGMSVLLVGGLSGIDFLSRFLAGNDGYGYLDAESGDMQGASGTSALNRVWPQGPFYMQNDAASTVFLYGPKMLRSVGVHVVGVPATELPPGTKHYYMTDEEISVVFEVPAGEGRIIFVGYDFNQIEPQWADVLLLAERELQLKDEVEPPPPQEKEYPKPYGITEPSAAPEEKELELENDIRKLVNYYCAQWMTSPSSRSLGKCKAQDCDNNRILDLGGGDTFEFCHWMNPHGFCYTMEAAEYCAEHKEDTVQCFDAVDNPPKYEYDPEDCGF
mmetsp:Transcript_31989/g.76457  ORF Transcript_31989/g.76457 Transcript_31989/m.76457 type:complete len:506 (+) Transcript_31989:92-1609(+)